MIVSPASPRIPCLRGVPAALAIATLASCFSSFGRPREVLHPEIPSLTLQLRHLTYMVGDTGREVQPLLVLVSLSRSYGRIRRHEAPPPPSTVLHALLVENGTARIPHYVPAPGEDRTIYFYQLAVTQFMPDTVETVLYSIHDSTVGPLTEGLLAPYGYFSGPESPDDRSEFPIGANGLIQIDVPYRRKDWEIPRPTEDVRLLRRIRWFQETALSEDIASLPKGQQAKVADWALARLEELSKKMGHTPEIQKLRDYWLSVKAEPR